MDIFPYFLPCFASRRFSWTSLLIFDVFWLRGALSRTFLLIFQRIFASRPFLADISTYFSTHFGFKTLSREHFYLFFNAFWLRDPFSRTFLSIFLHVSASTTLLMDSSRYFPTRFVSEILSHGQFTLFSSMFWTRQPFPVRSIILSALSSRRLPMDRSTYFH